MSFIQVFFLTQNEISFCEYYGQLQGMWKKLNVYNRITNDINLL